MDSRGHTRCSGYRASDERRDAFACIWSSKIDAMPDFDSNACFENQNRHIGSLSVDSPGDEDLKMEQILENINTTPIGKVLKEIASLPEVRRQKILSVRQQLTEGKYDLNKRLEDALDKVLEDLTA